MFASDPKKIAKSYGTAFITVTDSGDEYVIDNIEGDINLYKNGEFYKKIDTVEGDYNYYIKSNGNDIYTVVSEQLAGTTRVRKNDTLLYTLNAEDAYGMAVDSEGNVYSITVNNDWTLYKIWKNNEAVYTLSYAPDYLTTLN